MSMFFSCPFKLYASTCTLAFIGLRGAWSASLWSSVTVSITRLPLRWMPYVRATSGNRVSVLSALKCTS